MPTDSTFPRRASAWHLLVLVLLTGGLLTACGSSSTDESQSLSGPEDSSVCDEDDGGLTLADGFCATVVADDLGATRHLVVDEDGDVYAALRSSVDGHGMVALRDENGDYRADEVTYFADSSGTGIGIRNGYLYFAPDTGVWRYKFNGDELVPSGEREVVVSGFPEQQQHAVKPFTFDGNGNMYVNVGAPSNACQKEMRTPGSQGMDPCPQLERHAGIWKFSADDLGQTQTDDGTRYASGIRNAVALQWNDAADNLYVMQHGRDQLHSLFPDIYTQKESAELPSAEFFKVDEGDDFGWPYCYHDWKYDEQKELAPEYGGDGTKVGRCDQFEGPIMAFPGHWAPNGLKFYTGSRFPDRYQNGALIAFHGSWNRAPFPQQGYKVSFVPMEDGMPASDEWTDFADGFAGTDSLKSPRNAEYRPTGLAIGPKGGVYVADDTQGRIWRITYVGKRSS